MDAPGRPSALAPLGERLQGACRGNGSSASPPRLQGSRHTAAGALRRNVQALPQACPGSSSPEEGHVPEVFRDDHELCKRREHQQPLHEHPLHGLLTLILAFPPGLARDLVTNTQALATGMPPQIPTHPTEMTKGLRFSPMVDGKLFHTLGHVLGRMFPRVTACDLPGALSSHGWTSDGVVAGGHAGVFVPRECGGGPRPSSKVTYDFSRPAGMRLCARPHSWLDTPDAIPIASHVREM